MRLKSRFFVIVALLSCVHLGAAEELVLTKRYSDGRTQTLRVEPQPVAQKKSAQIERYSKKLTTSTLSFNITYEDSAGNGFNDTTDGADRQACLEAVLTYIASTINHVATIDVVCEVSLNAPGSSTLASAGTYYFTSPNGFKGGMAFDHITTNTDPTGSVEDIFVEVNFGKTWNSDHTVDPAGGEFDLFSVLLHEITHGLGITSLITSDGTGGLSNDNVYSSYDAFLEDNSGTALINPSTFTFQGNLSDLTTGSSFYTGTQATSFEGNDIPIYTPSTFSDGSSIAHWDTGYNTSGVMNPSIPPATKRRAYVPFELRVLQDLGYTVNINADLSLSVSVPTSADAGTNVVYSITVTNSGPSMATGITVDASLPSNTSYVSDNIGADYNSGTGVWTIASLASGANTTINITHTWDQVGTFNYYSEITAADQSDPDSTVNDASSGDDDDDAGQVYVGFVLSENSLTVDESGDPDETFTVVLQGDPGVTPVVIRLTEDDADDSEININGGAGPVDLTFTTANWDTPQTVTVEGKDDSVLDGTKSITITASVQSGPATFTALADQTVDVDNDDDDGESIIFTTNQIVLSGSTTLNNVSSFTYTVTGGGTGSESGGNWDVTIPLDVSGNGNATLNFEHEGGTNTVPLNVSESPVPAGGI